MSIRNREYEKSCENAGNKEIARKKIVWYNYANIE